MTAILGISAFYHDSAAALLVDGETDHVVAHLEALLTDSGNHLKEKNS